MSVLLLVSERFNWVEARGFPGGPNAKDQTDTHAGNKTTDGGPQWDVRGHYQAQQKSQEPTNREPDKTSESCKSGGLDQELPHDVAAASPDCFAHANLARSFGN